MNKNASIHSVTKSQNNSDKLLYTTSRACPRVLSALVPTAHGSSVQSLEASARAHRPTVYFRDADASIPRWFSQVLLPQKTPLTNGDLCKVGCPFEYICPPDCLCTHQRWDRPQLAVRKNYCRDCRCQSFHQVVHFYTLRGSGTANWNMVRQPQCDHRVKIFVAWRTLTSPGPMPFLYWQYSLCSSS